MAFPKRIDSNQNDIVKILRKLGASVQILSNVGKGCPDLLIGLNGNNYLIEVKDGEKSPSQQKLTDCEQSFFYSWKGQACIINSMQSAIDFIASL